MKFSNTTKSKSRGWKWNFYILQYMVMYFKVLLNPWVFKWHLTQPSPSGYIKFYLSATHPPPPPHRPPPSPPPPRRPLITTAISHIWRESEFTDKHKVWISNCYRNWKDKILQSSFINRLLSVYCFRFSLSFSLSENYIATGKSIIIDVCDLCLVLKLLIGFRFALFSRRNVFLSVLDLIEF